MLKHLPTVVFMGLFVTQAEGRPAPWIELERTECQGICPVFTVRIFNDGRVEYLGRKYVVEPGAQRGRIKPSAMEKLRLMIAELKIENLSPDCCSCFQISDQPWTNLEIVDRKRTHRVRHYHGCKLAPAGLVELEEEIIEGAGAQRWIGSETERARRRETWFRQNEAERFVGI